MDVQLTRKKFPGTLMTKTIEITYDIPSGIQLSYHENPGNPYGGTYRTAYLPNNEDGRKLLTRLKYAWLHGLLFTVGTSLTTGESDVVTWSSIPHKTSLKGGPFGWPDPNYFYHSNTQLDSLQVPIDVTACIAIPSQPQLVNQHAVREEKIFYSAPSSLATSTSLSGILRHPSRTETEDCSICLEPLLHRYFVYIQDCGHAFHSKCIEESLEHEPKCPVCRQPVGELQGKCPSGSMSIKLSSKSCPGFPNTKTIEITYDIPSGMQLSYHENPSTRYEGTTRTAYLPNNDEGRRLLTRLKYAWTHGLTFQVGTSLTTGRQNVVTWTSIHHRTSLAGSSHGFPDMTYIDNCNGSLDALHVPVADAC